MGRCSRDAPSKPSSVKAHLDPPAPPEPNVILEMTMAEAKVLFQLSERGAASSPPEASSVRDAIHRALGLALGAVVLP